MVDAPTGPVHHKMGDSLVVGSSFSDLVKLIPRPAKYTGEFNDDVISWINKMQLYFDSLKIASDDVKLSISVLNLDGRAIRWMTGLVELKQVPVTWDAFKEDIKKQFRNVNAVRLARDKLDKLVQVNSVSTYNDTFVTLLTDIGDQMDDKERLYRYTKGLKPEQQMRVVTANPSTLKEAMEIAHNIDSILWSVKQSNRYQQYKNNTNSSSAPMELDSIKHKPNSSNSNDSSISSYKPRRGISNVDPKEVDRRKREGLCLRCGKAGHRIATCRNFH